jgi:gliding motility-associated-like protein
MRCLSLLLIFLLVQHLHGQKCRYYAFTKNHLLDAQTHQFQTIDVGNGLPAYQWASTENFCQACDIQGNLLLYMNFFSASNLSYFSNILGETVGNSIINELPPPNANLISSWRSSVMIHRPIGDSIIDVYYIKWDLVGPSGLFTTAFKIENGLPQIIYFDSLLLREAGGFLEGMAAKIDTVSKRVSLIAKFANINVAPLPPIEDNRYLFLTIDHTNNDTLKQFPLHQGIEGNISPSGYGWIIDIRFSEDGKRFWGSPVNPLFDVGDVYQPSFNVFYLDDCDNIINQSKINLSPLTNAPIGLPRIIEGEDDDHFLVLFATGAPSTIDPFDSRSIFGRFSTTTLSIDTFSATLVPSGAGNFSEGYGDILKLDDSTYFMSRVPRADVPMDRYSYFFRFSGSQITWIDSVKIDTGSVALPNMPSVVGTPRPVLGILNVGTLNTKCSGEFHAVSLMDTLNPQYEWSGTGISCTACPNPTIEVHDTTRWVYVRRTVNDGYSSCMGAITRLDSIQVIPLPEPDCDTDTVVIDVAALPNIVTPNGDGINDVFGPTSTEQFTLSIYDRWGNQVFSANNERWVPAANLPEGVYIYHLRFDNLGVFRAGTITLLR